MTHPTVLILNNLTTQNKTEVSVESFFTPRQKGYKSLTRQNRQPRNFPLHQHKSHPHHPSHHQHTNHQRRIPRVRRSASADRHQHEDIRAEREERAEEVDLCEFGADVAAHFHERDEEVDEGYAEEG